MKTEQYKNGCTATHGHSGEMVKLATKELIAFLKKKGSAKPGELEDEFAGQWSLDLAPWRATPHFPALARLVSDGKVDCGKYPDGDVCYALKGKLPEKVKKE